MPPATARITHYAWPGGLAAIFEASTPCAAVFGPAGWHVGAPDIVFADGPPQNAETAQLRLPRPIVERIASLEFGGAALHTDFVHLDRYVARLQADQVSAVVLVLGSKSAVLDVHDGTVTVVEPPSSSTSGAVIKQARGWILVITGSLQPQPTIVTSPRESAAAAERPVAPTPVEVAPAPPAPVQVAPIEAPAAAPPIEVARAEASPIEAAPIEAAPIEAAPIEAAPIEAAPALPVIVSPPVEVVRAEVAPSADVAPAVETAPPADVRPAEHVANGASARPQPTHTTPAGLDSVFGRFAGDARYLLSPGVADNLPPEVAAVLAGVVSNGVTGTVLRLLDGAHTLAEIASETGLTPGQVGGILEALVSHRLAFKYVSRPRPAAGASASR